MDHLDYIRIRNLADSDAEVFQGIGGSDATAAPPGDTTRIADALEKGLLTEDTEGVLEKALLQTDDNDELQSVFAKNIPANIKAWMAACETFLSGGALSAWIDQCWAVDAANVAAKAVALAADPPLPVPLPTPLPPLPLLPPVPTLPPTGPTDLLWQIFMYFLKRYILHLVKEFLRKLINKLPGWIDRPPSFDGIVQALKDLQFNDLEFALPGGGRIHIWGEYIKR